MQNLRRRDGKLTFVLLASGSPSRTRNEPCNTLPCPTWSSWSIGLNCSVTCGNGTQLLTSNCEYNNTLQPLCDGNNPDLIFTKSRRQRPALFYIESGESMRRRNRSCNTQSCPAWSSWTQFLSCSVTCGNGSQQFSSTCMYNGNAFMTCSGKLKHQ